MIRKFCSIGLFSFLIIILTSFVVEKGGYVVKNNGTPTQKSRLRKIVLDAGHGGHDGGAPGRYSTEKEVALAITLRLEELLRAQMPEIELVVTRRSDIYQHPTTKAKIANEAKGDLFVCIHCNSAPAHKHREFIGYKTETYYTGKGKKKKKRTRQVKNYRTYTTPNPAKGTETYIWGAHKNDVKEIAMKENESLYLDSTLAKSVANFDADSPEKMITLNLKTRQYFERSAFLALTIQEEFKKAGRVDREALQRQVGIWVLQAVAMPAVLVETGYISNPEEEDYLNSKEGQTEIAQAIVNAIKRYQYSIDNKSTTVASPKLK